MQKASAVIYVTGANLDGYSHQNSNYEAMLGPLTTNDLMSMRAYLNGGGNVFISGMAAALSDEVWTLIAAGASPVGFSEYDNRLNDKAATGGISPPEPSATVDTNSQRVTNRWLFGGMKKIDFSTKGDGASDNLAVQNPAANQAFGQALVGVTAMAPVDGDFGAPYGKAWGQAALMTTDTTHGPTAGPDVAMSTVMNHR